ncbi:hypothetical protein ABZ635_00140 [Nocardiopsis sp. NPDC007018]|uniref:hypothetical protein n=1 Tax=Nocardiopsis sp. NPDC007018 TaxID=3155721 RepID=UPI0033F6ECEF
MAKQPREFLQWHLLDRSEDPVPWLPSDVRSLKRFYERLSDAAKQAAEDMRRLEGDELGQGDAVSALQDLVKELPRHLDKAQDAYEKGYRALDKWAVSLGAARMDSASIVHRAVTAHSALEDPDAWTKKLDGEDPVRKEFVDQLKRVLDDMEDAARDCADALEEAKQGSPRKLWGWLDKIVTWVEDNPLLYAVAMVVAGLAAIFIPGLGIALALTVLAISAASLHKEGKLGFNRESLFTLGMDALSLVPGGALLRGGRAVGKAAGQAATRVVGQRVAGGVSRTASSVRRGVGGPVSSVVGRANRTTGGKIATTIVKDSATSMASSITVQVAGEGKSLTDINMTNEVLTAFGTSAAGSTLGVYKDNGSLPDFFGGGSGSGGSGGGSDPASGAGGSDPVGTQGSSGGGDTGEGGPTTGGGGTGEASPSAGSATPESGPAPMGGLGDSVPQQGGLGDSAPQTGAAQADTGGAGGSAGSGDAAPESAGAPTNAGGSSADSGVGGGAGSPETTGARSDAGGSSPEPAGAPANTGGQGDAAPQTGAAHTDTGSPDSSRETADAPANTGGPADSSAPSGADQSESGSGGSSSDAAATREDSGTADSSSAGARPGSDGSAPEAPTDTGGSQPDRAEGPGTNDAEGGQGGRGDGTQPPEEFAPVTRTGGGANTPQPSGTPRARVGEPGDVETAPANRDPQPDTDPRSGARSDGEAGTRTDTAEPEPVPSNTDPAPTGSRSRTDQTAADPAPAPGSGGGDGPAPRSSDGATVTHTRTAGQGEFTTTRGTDGERNVAYRHPATREGDPDFTMNVTRDGVDVNGTSVRNTERGFDMSSADGSSVRAQRDGADHPGDLELTGPGGRGRASYRDGELTVSTSDGDVSVSRDPNGNQVRTADGLTVRQDGDGLRVSHTGDGPVRQRFDGDGPTVHRLGADENGHVPPARVFDPSTGRHAEVGADGYTVQTPGGSTHGYDRTDGGVRVETGDARTRVGSDSAQVSSMDGGVDLRLGADGTGSARGGGSEVRIGSGGVELRGSHGGRGGEASIRQEPDARGGTRPVARAEGVTAEPGRVSVDGGPRVEITELRGPGGGPGPSVVRVVEGGRESVYDMNGQPVGGGGVYTPLPRDPATGAPYVPVGSPDGPGTRVTVERGPAGAPGDGAALRVDGPGQWSVRTSRDGEMSMTPLGDHPDAVGVTRRPDGSTLVRTRESGYAVDSRDGFTVTGPGGLGGRADAHGVSVSDGAAVTTVRAGGGDGAHPGEPSALTSSATDPRQRYGESSGDEASVSTGDGTSVWTRDGELHTTMGPERQPGSVRSGDRTVEVGSDSLTARGAGRDADSWEVSTGPDRTSGHNGAQSIEVTAKPGRPGVQNPVHTGNGRWPRLRDPLVSPDQVRFESGGNVSGTRSASGRAEVTDGASGTTVRDARGGVRVESGGGPELRVTERHVRVTAPDGVQSRVEIPGTGADATPPAAPGRSGGGTARVLGDEGAAPDQARDGSRSEGEGAAVGEDLTANGSSAEADGQRGSGSSERPERDPVRTLRDTRRAALQPIPYEIFKNVLNVVAGTGFDFGRHFVAEVTGLDWLSEGIAFGPDGLPNPSYVVQSFMQVGTAIPKAAAEGRFGGGDTMLGYPLELGHQAMRNNLRDEYLDEYHEDFREGEKVEKQLEVLNSLLTKENLTKYEDTRLDDHPDPDAAAEQERADEFLARAKAEREQLEVELAELYDVSLADVQKMRD